MTTVITYGTFDLFHIGHLRLLSRLREIGDKVVVGVSTDEFNRLKGKTTIMPFEQRIEIVRSVRYVDAAFAETCWDQKEQDIKTYGADIFAIGEDWKGRFDYLEKMVKVCYLPRTQGVSSTQIRATLALVSKDQLQNLRAALDVMTSIVDNLA